MTQRKPKWYHFTVADWSDPVVLPHWLLALCVLVIVLAFTPGPIDWVILGGGVLGVLYLLSRKSARRKGK